MNVQSTPCPACRTGGTSVCETVEIAELAVQWNRTWPTAPAPSVQALIGWMSEDIAAGVVRLDRCAACGLEFSETMRAWSANHYPAQSHGLGYDQMQALAHLSASPPLDVLEIGCGCGEFLKSASALGHRCLGIDFSVESVARAQAAGVNARVMDLAELAAWQDRPQAFDAIAMFQVIEHLERPDQLFAEIADVVKPDSLLFVGCPSPTRITRRIAHAQRVGTAEFWDYPPQHVMRWNPQALEAFLARHGWDVESVEHEPFRIAAAAAELVAIDGLAGGWYANPLRRRLSTLVRRAQLTALSLIQTYTGTRLFVRARRRR
ncbi:MAG TPA: methyltransferase domain-containing protein [Planctomycetaceae bacterium]|nr:methyltransferase domain-containing protein [Planctomycetaceae bacterium]